MVNPTTRCIFSPLLPLYPFLSALWGRLMRIIKPHSVFPLCLRTASSIYSWREIVEEERKPKLKKIYIYISRGGKPRGGKSCVSKITKTREFKKEKKAFVNYKQLKVQNHSWQPWVCTSLIQAPVLRLALIIIIIILLDGWCTRTHRLVKFLQMQGASQKYYTV